MSTIKVPLIDEICMKKVLSGFLFLFFGTMFAHNFSYATLYINEDTKPLRIIDYIKEGGEDIVETDLDQVNQYGPYQTDYKVSNTLESVRVNVAAYLQRIAGIGLIASVILLIYNGIVLMTSPLSSDQSATVKKRIRYILIGALAITGFYFVLRVLLSILLQLLNN